MLLLTNSGYFYVYNGPFNNENEFNECIYGIFCVHLIYRLRQVICQ